MEKAGAITRITPDRSLTVAVLNSAAKAAELMATQRGLPSKDRPEKPSLSQSKPSEPGGESRGVNSDAARTLK